MANTDTLTTKIESLKVISSDSKNKLLKQGINTLSDVSLSPFMNIIEEIDEKDSLKFYKLVYKANVEFKFDPDDLISSLPILSANNKKKLQKNGYSKISDFNDIYYPSVYDLIGIGPAKELLVIIIASGASVKYDVPNWQEEQWKEFTYELINLGLVTWEDIAVCICSELNPPQVGTAVANQVKDKYPPREAMKNVFKWFYDQSGKCEASGKWLWLEVDHKVPKEHFIRQGIDPKEANTLDNFQLLTKRQNVIKRGSHRLGGLSFAQASAVLVYILLRYKPKNIANFEKLCRNYGLTMASVRFQEAWALAIWLSKDGMYEID